MNEKQRRLVTLLKEMFQLNQTDLDFGIYRIMNQKADEINEFLEKDLIQSIKAAFSSKNNDSLQKELDVLCKNITNAGMNPDDSPKVQELKEKIASASNFENDENEIYSYLTNFFSRYYKDGDFVSLRRYKKDTYAIPYEGEEVKLHWANSDQYYIKTSEFFRDYTFTVKNKKFHFKLVDADTEKNNNKASSDKERRFILDEETPIFKENGEVFVRFEYKPIGKTAQNKLNDNALKVLLALEDDALAPLKELAPTPKNKDRTILEKHLTNYTSRNSFDYFIHKDLNGFLSRELDFFIKNEILYIDDILETSTSKIESSLNKVKTFKTIANKVIAFLSQLEEFQKKLWLKKKFVIDTNYCITLDKITGNSRFDESFYQEIFDNKEQLKEWKELFKVEVKSIEDLKEEKFLVLDTKFFDDKFKNKLLSEFDDIDEECDGVLINSENFGALSLINKSIQDEVSNIFIDPPYNTGDDGFLYQDNYKSSSWLSMIEQRLILGFNTLKNDGVFFVSIGDEEQEHLATLVREYFGKERFFSTLIWEKKKKGSFLSGQIARMKDYILCISKDETAFKGLIGEVANDTETYPCVNASNPREIRIIQPGIASKYREKDYILKEGNTISAGNMNLLLKSDLVIKDGKLSKELIIEGNWRYSQESMNQFSEKLELYITQDLYLRRIVNEPRFKRMKDLLPRIGRNGESDFRAYDVNNLNKYGWGTNEDANDELHQLLGEQYAASYPKPSKLLTLLLTSSRHENGIWLDYFAGSGTTGHAVINLNREDNGNRKYILVEMGEYFETVTKPRIQKVIYTNNWKNGSPQDKNGISQMFKYFKLESYEDSLNNLAFKDVNKDLFDHDVKEDYLLNYMLDYETSQSLLNIDAFKTPFDYKLKIASSTAGETVPTNVDLVETFNYLIGLKVKTRKENKGFLVIQGQNLKEEKILIIWRNGQSNDDLNSFFEKMDWTVYDREFDTIYVNGDNNLANLKKEEDHFKVKLIEEEFKNRMFDA